MREIQELQVYPFRKKLSMKYRKTWLILNTAVIVIFLSGQLLAGYYDRGRKSYIYKKYDRAREMFLKAVETTDNGDAYYFLGEIEKISGNYGESEKYFRICVTKKSTTKKYLRNAFWGLIVYAEQKSDYDEVIRICKQMWETMRDQGAKSKIESVINKYLWSDNTDAVSSYKAGMELKKRRSRDRAQEKFREAVSADPYFLAPKFELGMDAYKKGDLDTAISYLSEIGSRIPFYAEVHLILGTIYYNRSFYTRAAEHYTRGLEFGIIPRSTESVIRMNRATCYYNMHEYEMATQDLEVVTKSRKKDVKPLILLSAVRIRQEKYDDALETLLRINRISPDRPLVLFQIGSIYYKKEDWRCISYFDRLFDISLKNKETEKYARAFVILLNRHFTKGHYKRVLEIVSALPESSIDYEISLVTARTYFHLADYDRSIEHFEKLSLKDDDRILLCRAYILGNRRESAKQMLEELFYSTEFIDKARKESTLAPLIREIEKKREQARDRESETPER